MSKQVYQYDYQGMFVGIADADESPLEPGVYHIPARCAEVAPPEDWPADKWPRWNGSAWVIGNKPRPANDNAPLARLQAFLNQNPDIAEMLVLNNVDPNV